MKSPGLSMSPAMNPLPPFLEGDGWTGEWGNSFASRINGLLDPGIPAQGKATKNRVRNGTIEGVVSAEEILTRLKAAFERERAANNCQAKRLALLCRHMHPRLLTLPLARGNAGRSSRLTGSIKVSSCDFDFLSPHIGFEHALGINGLLFHNREQYPYLHVNRAGAHLSKLCVQLLAEQARAIELLILARRARRKARRIEVVAHDVWSGETRVGPADIWIDAPHGTDPHPGEQIDPVIGLSGFVASLLKSGCQIEEEAEPAEAEDEWALLFDTRVRPKLTGDFNADDDRLGDLHDRRGGTEPNRERVVEAVSDALRNFGSGHENAPGWELGMRQLGHLFDEGISIEPIPGHSRRTALRATPLPKPVGERAMREWAEAQRWKRDNSTKLLEPKPKYRRRDDFNRKAGFELALRRVRSIIRHDPAMWTSLCAAYELLPRRVSDRNKDARDMQVLDWLIEVEERLADERDRQIVLCWFRERLSEREFAKAKGLPRSTFRDILARYCKLITTRLNARNAIVLPFDQRIEFDISVVRGVEAIGEVTQRSLNSTMRLIDDPKSPIAMLNGEPAALRKLIQAEPYRSRTKAASPCPESNHAQPLLTAE
jgi:hypothetical protein